jgi:hypothetical protein
MHLLYGVSPHGVESPVMSVLCRLCNLSAAVQRFMGAQGAHTCYRRYSRLDAAVAALSLQWFLHRSFSAVLCASWHAGCLQQLYFGFGPWLG